MVFTSGGDEAREDARLARAIGTQCSRSYPLVEASALAQSLTTARAGRPLAHSMLIASSGPQAIACLRQFRHRRRRSSLASAKSNAVASSKRCGAMGGPTCSALVNAALPSAPSQFVSQAIVSVAVPPVAAGCIAVPEPQKHVAIEFGLASPVRTWREAPAAWS